MKKNSIYFIILGLIIVVVFFIFNFNNFNKSVVDSQNSWEEVENIYTSKQELIPKLIKIIDDYSLENNTLSIRLNTLKLSYKIANTPTTYSILDLIFSDILNELKKESYSSSSNVDCIKFINIYNELEIKLCSAKKNYNEKTNILNTSIRKFPNNVYSRLFGIDSKSLFELAL